MAEYKSFYMQILYLRINMANYTKYVCAALGLSTKFVH